jgi:hypothetical protein
MRQDVVELSPGGIDIQQVTLPKLNVVQSEVRDDRLSLINLPLGKLDSNKVTLQKLHRLGNQIQTSGASQFQDPTI